MAESTMQQRRDEILAKKAKLAELKRQRELRKQETASRQSLSGSPLAEVRPASHAIQTSTDYSRYFHLHHDEAKTPTDGLLTSIFSSTVSLERADPLRHNLAHQPAQDDRHGRHR
jgi:DNA-binding helix-hairpin-helix protein with protein kinase domain